MSEKKNPFPSPETFLANIAGQVRDAVRCGILKSHTHKVNLSLKGASNGRAYWECKAVVKPDEPLVGDCPLFAPPSVALDRVEAEKLAEKLCPPGMSVSLTDAKTGTGVKIERVPADDDSAKKAA